MPRKLGIGLLKGRFASRDLNTHRQPTHDEKQPQSHSTSNFSMVRPSLYATSGGRTGAYSQTAGTPLRDRYRQILDSEQGTRNSEREHSSPLQRHDVSTLEISMRTEVIMALDLKEKETIGCAFFRAADGVLSVSGDVTMASLEIAHQFIEHVQPTTVLVSARAPDSFIEFLELISDPSTADNSFMGFALQIRASLDFSNQTTQESLANLPVLSEISPHLPDVMELAVRSNGRQANRGEINQMKYSMKYWRDDEDNVSFNCAGAVLAELQRRRTSIPNPNSNNVAGRFYVSQLIRFCLSNYMLVEMETLFSLQILRRELHPNSQVWGPSSSNASMKEGLSIYGLFQQLACTSQGRHSLRQMFLRPTMNLALIQERQQTISLLLRPDNCDLMNKTSTILRKIKNITTVVERLRKGVDSPSACHSFDRSVWATLRDFSVHVLRLKEILGAMSCESEAGIFRKFRVDIICADLLTIGDMINSTIDFDQSKSRSRPSVLSGIDTQLDKLKRRYDGMGSFLTSAVNRVNQNLPEWARQYIRSCIFLPQLGFLMEVETDPTTGNGMYEGEGAEDSPWEKLFTAEGAVCYKNGYMKELDDAYGDMYCEIGDREVEIIHGLSNQVLQYAAALTKASDICGEFDAIFALASGAKKYGLVAPRMTSQNILSIQNGRHLLQELVVPSFVTNDCDLSGYPNAPGLEEERDIFQALLITGPNNSGKSVYLKQVAIIVYLAHIGSFVPASAATIGLTDKIYTRLSTTESYSRNESAFAIDLKQVDKAVKNASSRSLILIDEFGKGTNADDGAGLLAGLLAYFLAKSREANPRLLVVTHFHELIEGNYLQSLQRLGMVHMDVRADRNVDPEGRQVTYLFKLIAGYNLSSFGSSCAQSSGVPDAVVQRASLIAQLLACNEDLGLTCAKLSKKEESQLEEAELVARQFLQCDFQSLQPSNLGTGSGLTIKSVLKRMLFPEHETNSFLN